MKRKLNQFFDDLWWHIVHHYDEDYFERAAERKQPKDEREAFYKAAAPVACEHKPPIPPLLLKAAVEMLTEQFSRYPHDETEAFYEAARIITNNRGVTPSQFAADIDFGNKLRRIENMTEPDKDGRRMSLRKRVEATTQDPPMCEKLRNLRTASGTDSILRDLAVLELRKMNLELETYKTMMKQLCADQCKPEGELMRLLGVSYGDDEDSSEMDRIVDAVRKLVEEKK